MANTGRGVAVEERSTADTEAELMAAATAEHEWLSEVCEALSSSNLDTARVWVDTYLAGIAPDEYRYVYVGWLANALAVPPRNAGIPAGLAALMAPFMLAAPRLLSYFGTTDPRFAAPRSRCKRHDVAVKTPAPRTSITDPLQIASLALGPRGGRVGLTLCPGKHARSLLASPPWARDLSADVQAIKAWGAMAVLTLIEPKELVALQVADLGAVVRSAGMAWLHQPICDGHAPDASFMRQWPALRSDLLALVQQGGSVLVHCRGGLGRAGTVAALLAIETGMAPAAAIAAVRAVRPGAIETAAQEAFVRAYRPASLS